MMRHVKNMAVLLAQWFLAKTIETLWWLAQQLSELGNKLARWVNEVDCMRNLL